MQYIFLFLLATQLLVAQNYSLRLGYGVASDKDLGDIIIGDFSSHPQHLSVVSLDGGYLLTEDIFDLPIDIYLKGGLSHFDESAASRDDLYEIALYIKAYYNVDFLKNSVRFGFGEGGSYTTRTLFVEREEALKKDGKTSYYLNYIDLSVDFDLGKLVGYKPLEGAYMGWALKHRSGIFGLINNVKKGGSNYNTIYIEKNF